MKYTDRKKTPLKWHRTVSFVIQPLLVIGIAWILFCMINELFSLHVPFAREIFTPVLKTVDSSLRITSLGSMFWPVTGTFFATIVFLILSISVWIGFLRWKNSSKNLWLIYLLVRTGCLIGGVVYLLRQSDALRALQTFAVFDSMSRNLLHITYALIIAICLWSLIFFILNFIYYHKRKLLFEPGYVPPENEETGSVSSKDEVVKKEENVSEPSEEKPEEAQNQTVSETDEKTETAVEQQPETESSEEKDGSDTAPESENTEEDLKESGTAEDNNAEQAESVVTTEIPDKKNEDQNPESEASVPVQKEEKTDEDEQKKPEKNGSDDLPQRDPNQVFCPYCGARLGKYDVIYCSHCGRKLT